MADEYDDDFGLSDAREPGSESAVGGEVSVDGSIEEMLSNAGIETGEETYEERFRYREDNGAVKSALGPGYTLGANPEEDPRDF